MSGPWQRSIMCLPTSGSASTTYTTTTVIPTTMRFYPLSGHALFIVQDVEVIYGRL